ncbi:MAG: hypothetical protein QXU18_11340 [Thermoplasmatales archaeon]
MESLPYLCFLIFCSVVLLEKFPVVVILAYYDLRLGREEIKEIPISFVTKDYHPLLIMDSSSDKEEFQ